MSDGSEFQVCGAATENARRANSVYQIKPGIERVQALADFRVRRYVVIAAEPVHRLQIRSGQLEGTPYTIPKVTCRSVQ